MNAKKKGTKKKTKTKTWPVCWNEYRGYNSTYLGYVDINAKLLYHVEYDKSSTTVALQQLLYVYAAAASKLLPRCCCTRR